MAQGERDILAALLREIPRVSGGDSIPRLLRAAAVLVEHAGYEIARSDTSVRVTQIILIAAELERLGETFERARPRPGFSMGRSLPEGG